MYFDAAVVFVTSHSLLFRLALAILLTSINYNFFSFSVSLQPFEYDPNEKNRHKFMVQAMFAPEGEINPDTLVRPIFFLLNVNLYYGNTGCGFFKRGEQH